MAKPRDDVSLTDRAAQQLRVTAKCPYVERAVAKPAAASDPSAAGAARAAHALLRAEQFGRRDRGRRVRRDRGRGVARRERREAPERIAVTSSVSPHPPRARESSPRDKKQQSQRGAHTPEKGEKKQASGQEPTAQRSARPPERGGALLLMVAPPHAAEAERDGPVRVLEHLDDALEVRRCRHEPRVDRDELTWYMTSYDMV